MQRSQQRPSSPGALVPTRKKTVWSPKPRWRIKHAWNSSQSLYYSRAIVFSDGAVVKYISPPGWTELVRPLPPPLRWPQRAFTASKQLKAWALSELLTGLRDRLEVCLFFFFLIFFPDAGGAGRRTQTRPDKRFKERSGGRCGVSASRSWLLVANRREWKQEPGCVCVWLLSSTFSILWWCLWSLMCSSSGNVLCSG